MVRPAPTFDRLRPNPKTWYTAPPRAMMNQIAHSVHGSNSPSWTTAVCPSACSRTRVRPSGSRSVVRSNGTRKVPAETCAATSSRLWRSRSASSSTSSRSAQRVRNSATQASSVAASGSVPVGGVPEVGAHVAHMPGSPVVPGVASARTAVSPTMPIGLRVTVFCGSGGVSDHAATHAWSVVGSSVW
ncbi:hypothetical protein CKY47_34520 [Saccharothrix yanglingensis]|uniref:Uncharacterized protein n=1 Tax=Saccharothrix yanglingensis TaxID=659496 RepID=A0ABU0XA10_9PSEU|nr:hypothetical protein [Saccharothrix yanglingensis]